MSLALNGDVKGNETRQEKHKRLAKIGRHSWFVGSIERVASTTSARSLYKRGPACRVISLSIVEVVVARGEDLLVFVEFVRKTSEKIEDV